jgi:hypothetical protein
MKKKTNKQIKAKFKKGIPYPVIARNNKIAKRGNKKPDDDLTRVLKKGVEVLTETVALLKSDPANANIRIANNIRKFLVKYAAKAPGGDKYTCPDAYQLESAADLLEKGLKPTRCWSDWGSGGYKPYSSKEGRALHDSIMEDLTQYMKS